MKKRLLSLFVMAAIFSSMVPVISAMPTVPAAEENVKQFHVSPNGKPANDGSKDMPLSDLESARAAVAAFKKNNPDIPIEVIFHEGTYRFTERINFAASDSGTEMGSIIYKAAEGENVYFKGSQPLDLSKVENVKDVKTLARIPVEARNNVLSIDLEAQGITELGAIVESYSAWPTTNVEANELYLNGRPQMIAQYPNGDANYTQYASVVAVGGTGGTGNVGGVFTTQDYRLMRWETAKDAKFAGFPNNDWLYEIIGIGKVDVAKKEVTLARNSIYGLSMSYSHRYKVINLIEELDTPGEYYIDRDEKVLYYWPETTLKGAELELTTLKDSFIYISQTDNISFEGINFEQGRGNAFFFDGQSENVSITNCRFHGFGQWAAYHMTRERAAIGTGSMTSSQFFDDGMLNFHFDNNIISDCGRGGVSFSFGERTTLKHSESTVNNNYLYNMGRIDKKPQGIAVVGVGVEIANNTIHDASWGISYTGNYLDVHHNEIFNILKENSDGGGIYCGRNFINRGNTVHHNYIHDIHTADPLILHEQTHGIYLDDRETNHHIYNNIIVGSRDAIMVNGGQSHNIHDNTLIDSTVFGVRLNTINMAGVSESHMILGENALKNRHLPPSMKPLGRIWKVNGSVRRLQEILLRTMCRSIVKLRLLIAILFSKEILLKETFC